MAPIADPWLIAALNRVARFCTRWAYAVVALSLALTAASGWYISQHVAVSTETENLISSEAPFRVYQREMREVFPDLKGSIVLSIASPLPEARLEAAQRVVEIIEEEPELFGVIFAPPVVPFFRDNGLLFRSVEEVERTIDQLAEAQPLLNQLAAQPDPAGIVDLLSDAIARSPVDAPLDPILVTTFESLQPAFDGIVRGDVQPLSWLNLMDTGDFVGFEERLLIEVIPALDLGRLRPARLAMDRLQEVAEDVEVLVPTVRIALTGQFPLQQEELESASVGAAGAGLMSLVLVALLLIFGVRSLTGVLAMLATMLVGLGLTTAAAVAIFTTFNLISVAFAVLFIGLGIDFAIHLLLRAQEAVSQGEPISDALATAVVHSGPALLICAPTTAVAFLAFTATDYVGLAQLGVIAALGMIIAVALSLTLLPAFLSAFGCAPLQSVGGAGLTRYVKPRLLRLLAYALIAISVAGLAVGLDVRFNSDPLNLRDPDAPSMRALEALRLGGHVSPYGAEILIPNTANAERLASQLEGLPAVERVLWRDRFIPIEQADKLAAIDDARLFLDLPSADAPPSPRHEVQLDEAFQALTQASQARLDALSPGNKTVEQELLQVSQAASAALAEQPQLAAEAQQDWFRFWPQMLGLLNAVLRAEAVDARSLPTELTSRYVALDGRLRLDVQPVAEVMTPREIEAFVAAVQSLAPNATGPAVHITSAGALVSEAMQRAMLLAAVGVGLMLLLVIRRPGDVFIILVTVIVATGLTLGAMWLFELDFNYANVIVLPLLLGFGIDTSIHMVMRARDEGEDATALLRTSTPRAVVLSALTTLASFGTLMTAAHRGTQSMGTLLTVAVVASLLASLVVLPALLRLREKTANALTRNSV